jgi:dipeptidyl aminopeptidase/acylaminoacyl peptidase
MALIKKLVVLLFVGILFAPVGPALASQPSVFTAEDMLDIVSFSGGQPLTMAPSGGWVTYVLPDMEDEWNIMERRSLGYVYVQPLTGDGAGEPRALSQGETRSSFPVWSPEGDRLAFFLEKKADGRLAVWDAHTGRVEALGESFAGRSYLAPQWDPSGERIVYAASVKEKEAAEPPRVRVVKSSDKRIPGDEFFLNQRKAILVLLDLSTGNHRFLTEKPVRLRSFTLSPDGEHVIYTAPSPETFGIIGEERNETFILAVDGSTLARKVGEKGERFTWHPDGRRLLYKKNGKLHSMPVAGGEPSPFLANLEAKVTELVWSPDGTQFISLVPDPSVKDPEIEPPQPKMYTIARPFMDLVLVSASDGTTSNLTASFEDQVSNPTWSPDGKSVFFRAVNNETYDETIYRYTLSDKKLQVITQGQESYRNLSAAPGALATVVEDATHPADLWLFETTTGKRKPVTHLNPQMEKFRFSKPELFTYYNADGERLGALLYKPVDFEPGMKVPVITYVYEKLTPGIHRFSARHQIFLNHGYAVLMPNVKVKVGETATSFVKSVVPAVNAVRAMGFTNGKFAMWGGSFGAYATSYVITQTDIFACAVSRATPPELFRNWASGRDRDSRNIESGQARMGGSPFEVMERYLSQSAFFHLDKVNTPVLIMHGVKDYTILFAEGEMMFYALRQLGKEAELVIYTHGDHSLSRHSRSDTLDVNRRMLDWFEKYLKK